MKLPRHVRQESVQGGRKRAWLVRNISFRRQNRRVRIEVDPTARPGDRAYADAAAELEVRAMEAKAKLSSASFAPRWMSPGAVQAVEWLRWMYASTLGLMSTSEIAAYERDFEVRYVRGTTGIEGNSLSLAQAADLLGHGRLPEGKSLREINEVQNFQQVRRIRDGHRGPVTKRLMRSLHGAVMANIDADAGGRFRRTDGVWIEGCDIAVTPSAVIEDELDELLADHARALEDGAHPLEAATWFHYRFEMIHPFADGNGRVGRELFNVQIMQAGYPRLLFLGERRDEYLDALRLGNHDDLAGMVARFVGIIVGQRMQVLRERLVDLARGGGHAGQTNLVDFS